MDDISLFIAVDAPLSFVPDRLSASSRIMSFFWPSEALRKLPSAANVLFWEPDMATLSISEAVLWSEAFISTVSHPISRASARAEVVLPMPGGPMSKATLCWGIPELHWRAQALRELTAEGLPTTSSNV